MRPIWYFVGLILLIMVGIIFLNGIYQSINPKSIKTVLKETQPSLWWGGIMILSDGTLYLKTKKTIR